MLSKSSIELALRDARCNRRPATLKRSVPPPPPEHGAPTPHRVPKSVSRDGKNCHVCWSGVGGASVACRAKVLAEMQRKDEWTEQVCGVSHFRANAEGSEMQMSCVGVWEKH